MPFYCPSCHKGARQLHEPARKPGSEDAWECPACHKPYDPRTWSRIELPPQSRATSIATYERIKQDGTLGGERLRVYEALAQHGPQTGSEIDKILNSPSAHKRLSELEEQGVVRIARVRPCTVTGNEASEWGVIDGALPVPLDKSSPSRLTKAEMRDALAALRHLVKKAGPPPDASLVKLGRWLSYRVEKG